jgi:hypothetical protein
VGAAKETSCLWFSVDNECGSKEEAISGSQSEMGRAEEKGEVTSVSLAAPVVTF